MPREVFISYCSEDETAANEVRRILESRGIDCWIAPRDILPGQSWASSIVGAIEECRILLVVISSPANRSRQIPREVELADSKKRRILPVRLEAVAPQKDLEYFISNRQWIDLFPPPVDSHAEAVVQAVATLRDTDTTHPDTTHPDATINSAPPKIKDSIPALVLHQPGKVRWLLAALAVTAIALTIGLVFIWTKSRTAYRPFLNDANEYAENRRWIEAIDSYDRALAKSPPASILSSVFDLRCHAKLEGQMFDEALDDCTLATQLDAKNVQARIGMGLAHLRLKQEQQAIADFQGALDTAKKSGDLPGEKSAMSWIDEAKQQAAAPK